MSCACNLESKQNGRSKSRAARSIQPNLGRVIDSTMSQVSKSGESRSTKKAHKIRVWTIPGRIDEARG